MKKALFLFTLLFAATFAHAKVKILQDPPRIISWNELSFEKIQELTHSKNSDFAVEFKAGTAIPLQFLIKNEFLSAMMDPNLVIKVDKTCYLCVIDKKPYISEDLIKWEKASKLTNGKSVLQLTPSSNKAGALTIEQTIVPYTEDEEEENWDQ